MRLIEKISQYMEAIKSLYSIPQLYAYYLEDGVYKWNMSATVLFSLEKAEMVSGELSDIFLNIYSTNNIFRKLFCNCARFRINKKPKQFSGQFLTISSSTKEIRIFDLKSRQLMTDFIDRNREKVLLKQRDFWSNYVPTVPYSFINDSIIVEPLINKRRFSPTVIYPSVLSIYINYFKEIDKGLFNTRQSNVVDGELTISELPCVMTHGDLWRSNVIFDGDNVYFIDFEHSKNRVFFYDLYMFMLMEIAMFDDFSIWQNYVAGKYDKAFSDIFEVLGLHYTETNKKEYFNIFLREFSSDRPSMAAGDRMTKSVERMLNSL